MLERVGGKLVNGKPDALGRLRLQPDRWALHGELFAFPRGAGAQLLRDQFGKVETCERITGDGRLDT